MGPEVLANVLQSIEKIPDPKLIIGFDSADDAAVYELNEDFCIIHTVDFFPPIVDDPYEFGQIAATNALSDVYAMGGQPISALNLLMIPASFNHEEITKEILRGGADKVHEAGINIAGGHSIEDKEPKYGLSVVGVVAKADILANQGAHVGDRIILTKALGSGILTTADKPGLLDAAAHRQLIAAMTALNRWPADQARGLTISAATDITGFGLLGHAFEMASASEVCLELSAGKLPLLAGARGYARDGIIPAGAYHNRDYVAGHYAKAATVPVDLEDVAFDPQTSGGLLYAMPPASAALYKARMEAAGLPCYEIGQVVPCEDEITVRLVD